METTLYIDGLRADTDGGTEFSVSLSISSLTDLETARTGYTRSLSIPMTQRNMSLLGDCHEIHARDRFNSALHTARVEASGATVMEGQLFLVRCEADGRGGGRYVLNILGAARLWVSHAAATPLSRTALPFGCTLTPEAVAAGWSSDAAVKFLPVQRGEYVRRNSSASLQLPGRVLSLSDFHPFIALRPLLGAIFAEAGYTLESRFMDGEFFRSLHISGNYPERDTLRLRTRYDFRASRFGPAEAAADHLGRVYASPYRQSCSVGDIVETADPAELRNGAAAEGVFTNNGCFTRRAGAVCFVPQGEISAGFEYSLRYATDYVIESRTRLRGFDTFHAGGRTFTFGIANRFEDRRSDYTPGYSYRAVVFDHTEGSTYEIWVPSASGQMTLAASFAGRTALFTAPAGVTPGGEPRLHEVREGVSRPCESDWALYGGHVGERGRTEVEVTLTTPPESVSPSSPKYFYDIWFGGAEEGMSLELLRETAVRPLFAANPCEGSSVEFSTVANMGATQLALINAVKQMFNLRFYTDTAARRVFAEPFDDFFDPANVVDWSDRLDLGIPVVVEEPGADLARTLTLRYREGGVAADDPDDDSLGSWSTPMTNMQARQGQTVITNSLFVAAAERQGVIPEAMSARLLAVEESTDGNLNIAPRIAMYRGLVPLPAGERWSWPRDADTYPSLLFHDPAAGLTLRFGDSDGCTGLHGRYDRMLRMINLGRRVTFGLRLTPGDVEPLVRLNSAARDFRAPYRIDFGGEQGLYLLEELADYNPATGTARGTFVKLI